METGNSSNCIKVVLGMGEVEKHRRKQSVCDVKLLYFLVDILQDIVQMVWGKEIMIS